MMENYIFDVVSLDQLSLAADQQKIELKLLLDDIDMRFAYRTAKLFEKAISNELQRCDFAKDDLVVKVCHTYKENGSIENPSIENTILIYIHIGSKWNRYDLHMSELIKRFLAETKEDEDTIFDWYDFIKRLSFEITCVGYPCTVTDYMIPQLNYEVV